MRENLRLGDTAAMPSRITLIGVLEPQSVSVPCSAPWRVVHGVRELSAKKMVLWVADGLVKGCLSRMLASLRAAVVGPPSTVRTTADGAVVQRARQPDSKQSYLLPGTVVRSVAQDARASTLELLKNQSRLR